MRLLLILLLTALIFGSLIADIELNPISDFVYKNDMSGTFGYGYLAETVEYGDILYCNSDGKWEKFDGTDANVLVMSSDYGKVGKLHKFLISGWATKYNWNWTVGGKLYPRSVAGEMWQVPQTYNENFLGIATATNEIFFKPQFGRNASLIDDLTVYGTLSIGEGGASISEAGDILTINVNAYNIYFDSDTPGFYPGDDNYYPLGLDANRWTTVYAYDGNFSNSCTAQKYISNITTTAVGGDAIDVSDCSILKCDSSIANITIGGFTGGVTGQILHLFNSAGNNIILEDDEGTGNQDIKTNTGADVTITAEGGATLVYDGTVWRIIGIAQ